MAITFVWIVPICSQTSALQKDLKICDREEVGAELKYTCFQTVPGFCPPTRSRRGSLTPSGCIGTQVFRLYFLLLACIVHCIFCAKPQKAIKESGHFPVLREKNKIKARPAEKNWTIGYPSTGHMRSTAGSGSQMHVRGIAQDPNNKTSATAPS